MSWQIECCSHRLLVKVSMWQTFSMTWPPSRVALARMLWFPSLQSWAMWHDPMIKLLSPITCNHRAPPYLLESTIIRANDHIKYCCTYPKKSRPQKLTRFGLICSALQYHHLVLKINECWHALECHCCHQCKVNTHHPPAESMSNYNAALNLN